MLRTAIVLLAYIALFSPAGAETFCNHEFTTSEALLADLVKENHGKLFFENDDYFAFQDEQKLGLFTFVKRGRNPAFPAVVCRVPFRYGDKWRIRLEAKCGGPKEACDKLVNEFSKLGESSGQESQ